MKFQLLFGPAVIAGLGLDVYFKPQIPVSVIAVGAFLISTIPFTLRIAARDPAVGAISPMVLAARSCSQLLGILAGSVQTRKVQS
jgi:hypothetical protein